MAAEQVQKFARGVRPLLECGGEIANPHIVVAELFLAREGVVDPIDPIVGERGVVAARRADVMMLAACFVQVVIEVGAGLFHAVDETVLDEIRDDHSETAGAQGACHPHENRHIVTEHLLPDAMSGAERSSLKLDAFEFFELLVGLRFGIDGERLDGHL